MINNLAKQIHENAKSKGFFDSEKNIGEMLCLIHSEVSEALEADRKDNYFNKLQLRLSSYECLPNIIFIKQFENDVKNTFEDELADIIIRVMDLAEFKGINLENHIKAKMRYNSLITHKNGKKY